MVQWLRTHTSTVWFWVQSLLRVLRPPKLTMQPKKEKKLVNLISQFKWGKVMKHSLDLKSLSQLSFFFKKFIYFNWTLVISHYCSGFCHTLTWISHGCTCSPSWNPLRLPSPSHPSGSSQCTSPEHPVSCIEPGLAICFTDDNIHVSMLFSQIIPPLPSPTESKRLFYTSVSLLLSHI